MPLGQRLQRWHRNWNGLRSSARTRSLQAAPAEARALCPALAPPSPLFARSVLRAAERVAATHPLAKIKRIGSAHPMLASTPARILNQNQS
jgi:hypothetical protein